MGEGRRDERAKIGGKRDLKTLAKVTYRTREKR
jgi:hypothetical protein